MFTDFEKIKIIADLIDMKLDLILISKRSPCLSTKKQIAKSLKRVDKLLLLMF